MSDQSCQNCNAALTGQYCASCGQRQQRQLVSLWVLLRELVGDLFEVDSRVWRTLIPLLTKPGFLTLEYLRGRRVHYTPPLRLYLVTSLIFFLFIVVTPDTDFDFSNVVINSEDDTVELIDESVPAGETGAAIEKPDICTQIQNEMDFGDAEFQAMVYKACENLSAPGGVRRFLNELFENIPTMMFFFLPVIALFMRALYLFSGRYYVEHLLFLVHFHSFVFLALTLTTAFARLPAIVPGQSAASDVLTGLVSFYTPFYLYKAMRRVYQQRRALTALKYVALGIAYFFSMIMLLAALALITALNVQ